MVACFYILYIVFARNVRFFGAKSQTAYGLGKTTKEVYENKVLKDYGPVSVGDKLDEDDLEDKELQVLKKRSYGSI
jgi:hypothetical protein